jgi:hypothetical protein
MRSANYNRVIVITKLTVLTHLRGYRRGMILPEENVSGRTVSIDDRKSTDERYKYLRIMQKRYKQANRGARASCWMRWK